MKRTIWKYKLEVTDEQFVAMPIGATVLSVQVQDGEPCIWALVDPDKPTENRTVRIYGTGHPIEDLFPVYRFVGTFQLNDGTLVFHMFVTD